MLTRLLKLIVKLRKGSHVEPVEYGRPYLVPEPEYVLSDTESPDLTYQWKRQLNDKEQARAAALAERERITRYRNFAPPVGPRRQEPVHLYTPPREPVQLYTTRISPWDVLPYVMMHEHTHRSDPAPEPYSGGGGSSGGAGASHSWGDDAPSSDVSDAFNMMDSISTNDVTND